MKITCYKKRKMSSWYSPRNKFRPTIIIEIMCKSVYIYLPILALLSIMQLKKAEKSKKFDNFFDGIKRANSEKKIFAGSMTVEKETNTKFTLTAELEQLVELNNDYEVEIIANRADLSSPEKYEVIFEMSRTPFCDFMDFFYPLIYDAFQNYSNIPPPDSCPFNPKKYTVTKAPYDAEPFNSMTKSGNLRLDVNLYKGDDKVEELQFLSHVTEMEDSK